MKHSSKVFALLALPAYHLRETGAFVPYKPAALVKQIKPDVSLLLSPPSFWVANRQTSIIRANKGEASSEEVIDVDLEGEEEEEDIEDDTVHYFVDDVDDDNVEELTHTDITKRTASSIEEQEVKVLESRMNSLTTKEEVAVSAKTPKGIWDPSNTIIVQGNSLRTWSYTSPLVQRVEVSMRTEGRPMDANVELWQGPDNTPVKMRVYVENGSIRPFNAVIETPGSPNTLAIRNVGQIEFPLTASVAANSISPDYAYNLSSGPSGMIIQGGALKTYPFESAVDSVHVVLKTDGRPLNARIELLQGPNNNKQVCEVYTEDGIERPFYISMDTPGSGNVVRIVNTAPVEFPLTAWIEAKEIDEHKSPTDAVLGGDSAW